jgi:hypothetical protein
VKAESLSHLAPIAFFVYKRPDKTQTVLRALAANPEIARSHLFVFCDGPRANADDADLRQIAETRTIIRQFKHAHSLTIIESECNNGLASSIKSGISTVLSKYEEVIILEDDIEVSPGFLKYMNIALKCYKSENDVAAICGYLPDAPLAWMLPTTFFLHHFTCWGWGTWSRVWRSVDWDASSLLSRINSSPKHLARLNFSGSGYFYQHLVQNACGKLKTWAIVFQTNACLHDQLCLFPHRSLVQNIGLDSSGENCGAESEPLHRVHAAETVEVFSQRTKESRRGRAYVKQFLIGGKANPAIVWMNIFFLAIRRRIGAARIYLRS